jgi:hypothetical protein
MTTKLKTPLRREIEIDGEPFTVLLDRVGVRIAPKRFRTGRFLSWRGLWERSGEDPGPADVAGGAGGGSGRGTPAARRRIQ